MEWADSLEQTAFRAEVRALISNCRSVTAAGDRTPTGSVTAAPTTLPSGRQQAAPDNAEHGGVADLRSD